MGDGSENIQRFPQKTDPDQEVTYRVKEKKRTVTADGCGHLNFGVAIHVSGRIRETVEGEAGRVRYEKIKIENGEMQRTPELAEHCQLKGVLPSAVRDEVKRWAMDTLKEFTASGRHGSRK